MTTATHKLTKTSTVYTKSHHEPHELPEGTLVVAAKYTGCWYIITSEDGNSTGCVPKTSVSPLGCVTLLTHHDGDVKHTLVRSGSTYYIYRIPINHFSEVKTLLTTQSSDFAIIEWGRYTSQFLKEKNMTFEIKTEAEQRLDHIRDLVESCEKTLETNRTAVSISSDPITYEQKLIADRSALLCTIRTIGNTVR